MAPRQPARRRHVPQRTCVGCRTVLAKRELIRIVRTPEGVQMDPTGRLAGRGAYIHNQRSCWESALRGKLASALKVEISEQELGRLKEHLESLPD